MKKFCIMLLLMCTNIFAYDLNGNNQIGQFKEFVNQITIDDIPSIQRGACFFGSGEGGALSIGMELFNKIKKSRTNWKTVKLVTRSSLLGSDSVFLAALIGSPGAVLNAQMFRYLFAVGIKANNLYIAKKHAKNKQNNSIMIATENGVINLFYQLILGMINGTSVYDGDMAGGRSVPELANTSFVNTDVNDAMISCDNPKQCKNASYITVHKTATLQKILADLCVKNKQLFAFAAYYMSARQFIHTAVYDGSISYALAIGKAMNDGTIEHSYQLVLEKLNQIYGKDKVIKLFEGRLEDMKFYPGFHTKGYILLLDIYNRNKAMRIYFLNENILATVGVIEHGKYVEKKVVAMAPDSINYLLPHGIHNQRYYEALTLSNSDIFFYGVEKMKGLEITVIGLPNYKLRTPEVINSFRKYIEDLAPNINADYRPLVG